MRLDAEDDRSNVILKLDVGTVPGGSDVLNKKELGGFSTALTEVDIFKHEFLLYNSCIITVQIQLFSPLTDLKTFRCPTLLYRACGQRGRCECTCYLYAGNF